MQVNQAKELRNRLLIACYMASVVGLTGVVWFFFASFNMTMAHVKHILLPAVIVLGVDAYIQYAVNNRLLPSFFKWYQLSAGARTLELGRQAQLEIVKFPSRSATVSMVLWILSASTVALMLWVFGSAYNPRQLCTMVVAIGSGGFISLIFQYSFYKRIFRRHCADLFALQTGIHRELKTVIINLRRKWIFGALVMLAVGLIYSAFMGNNRAAEAIMHRTALLLKNAGDKALELARPTGDKKEVDDFLSMTGRLLEQNIFVFNDEGKVVYGKMPGELTPGIIREYISEYENPLIRTFRTSDYFARNINSTSNEFFWLPLNGGLYIGSVFYRQTANDVLGGYNLSIILLVVFFVGVAYFVANFTAMDISEPMRVMLNITEKIAGGDLTENVNILSDDEIGKLAGGLQDMLERLRAMLSRIDESAENVDKAGYNIVEAQMEVAESAKKQVTAIEESSKLAGELNKVIGEISENIEVMAESSKESAKIIMEIEGLSNELSENIRDLSQSIENTSSAIYEMNASMKDMNESLEVLTNVAEETANATMEMDRAIKQVENHAKETLRISETVTEDAGKGVSAVQSTIEGIGRIEEGVREAELVISHLDEHAEEIGKILNVIADIADQTSLLALNAAIIAAQAGERGRSFAVVADEIKKLSDKTTSSAKEIRDLISAVQSETQKAVSVMRAEAQSVEEGVNLAFQAGQALEKIQKSAKKSADMATQIAAATSQQAVNSKRVTDAVSAIAERVSQIAASMREQARGAGQITQATSEMKEIAPMVRMKAQKQAESGKQVTLAMENIAEMVSYILKSQQKQQEHAERILIAMNGMKNILQANTETVAKLDKTVAVLTKQSEGLRTEVGRFKIPTIS